ncbi:adhesive plaque matrix protein 2-like [Pollicipes pollicipes]|uniref:adhesive plaque matrix protein 2-like n=1 Tax=Pollicipes pollicipes TaxID=41117 RepID=UPI001885821E|nr:adhesive plaque matrix protein 2-like [Pollicipes pollicipes]
MCKNGGTCTPNGMTFKCVCPSGWRGFTCKTADTTTAVVAESKPTSLAVQNCQKYSMCKNGGTCTPNGRTFKCLCPSGWRGFTCKTADTTTAVVAESKPTSLAVQNCQKYSMCKNGGSCTPNGKTFKCVCPSGWRGFTCKTPDTTTAVVVESKPTSLAVQNCQKYSMCKNGGTCTPNGRTFKCVCPSGWRGFTCKTADTTTAVVVESKPTSLAVQNCQKYSMCKNGGTCTPNGRTFKCLCPSGWRGFTCKTPDTTTAVVAESKPTSLAVQNCQKYSMCKNGGTCTPNGRTFKCVCPSGWRGFTCKTADTTTAVVVESKPTSLAVQNCQRYSMCKNGGTCTPNGRTFKCVCPSGWRGFTCKTPDTTTAVVVESKPTSLAVQNCQKYSMCKNGGTCTPNGKTFKCLCSSGWRGFTCKTPDTTTAVVVESKPTSLAVQNCQKYSMCKNGGTCTPNGRTFKCLCPSGWRGFTCKTADTTTAVVAESKPTSLAVQNCQRYSMCKNGATCTPNGKTFKCLCPSGWRGFTCKTPDATTAVVVESKSTSLAVQNCRRYSMCKNGGTCTPNEKTFKCLCPSGWRGFTCQAAAVTTTTASPVKNPSLKACQVNHLCRNGGTCQDAKNGFTCACAKDWQGARCTARRNLCSAERGPCQNGGTCSYSSQRGFLCGCTPAWQGETCQLVRDPCKTGLSCGSGFPCSRDPASLGGFSCDCDSRPDETGVEQSKVNG